MADPKLKLPEDPAFSAGRAARQGANAYGQAQRNVAATAGSTLVKPFVSAVKAAAPFVRGFAGVESPAAGTPRPAAAPAAAAPARAPSAPRPATPAAPAAAAVRKPTLLAPVTVRAPVSTGAHGESVYNNDTLAALGMTPRADAAVAGQAATPAARPTLQQPIDPVVARPTTAPAVRDSTQFALTGQRAAAGDVRADAAQFLNPMSNDAEIMRRLDISQGYGSNKGSPQARRMAGEAILGQLSARNEASAAGQAGANATLQQGAEGEGVANESAAQRRLEADQFNTTSAQTTAQRLAEQQRPSGISPIRDVTGRTSILRNDGSAYTLRDEQGQPLVTPTPATRLDTVSADTQYRTIADRLTALEQFGRPADPAAAAEYDRATTALQAQMQQLAGGAPRTGQPPAEAIAELKANPNAAADFDAVFGEGAAATYLNR